MKKHRQGTKPKEVPFPDDGWIINVREEKVNPCFPRSYCQKYGAMIHIYIIITSVFYHYLLI